MEGCKAMFSMLTKLRMIVTGNAGLWVKTFIFSAILAPCAIQAASITVAEQRENFVDGICVPLEYAPQHKFGFPILTVSGDLVGKSSLKFCNVGTQESSAVAPQRESVDHVSHKKTDDNPNNGNYDWWVYFFILLPMIVALTGGGSNVRVQPPPKAVGCDAWLGFTWPTVVGPA